MYIVYLIVGRVGKAHPQKNDEMDTVRNLQLYPSESYMMVPGTDED